MAGSEIRHARVGEIELAHQAFGDPGGRPLLLVMGLATQMLGWPDGLCEALAERGHHVVRFDNRDVGLSTHLHDAPQPDLAAAMTGDLSSASYLLADLAHDTAGLLDALGWESAHVAGASLGGMVAQELAIRHLERVRSLTSIMSTTGDRTVGGPSEAGVGALLSPPATTREEAEERAVRVYRVIGSPGYELDEAALRERARRSWDRAHDPAGAGRQLLAVLASPDRTPGLRELRVPTLVLHGAQDALVDVSGGRATAAAVPGAELVVLDGWGHDFPRALWDELADRIAAHTARAEDAPARAA
jgi:pimeloyl-ACP methyl ester carboxylesterase